MTHQTTVPWAMRLGALAVMIALMAVFMTVTVQADDPDWKVAPTGLTVSAGDEAGEINITWDAHPQTSKTLSDYRVTWTPGRRELQDQRPDRLVRLPDHQPGDGNGPGRRGNLPRSGSALGTTTTRSRAGATSQPDRAA